MPDNALLPVLWRDVIYAVRGFRRDTTFTVTALLTLTLGTVAAMTVFSVVNAELWKPLPFPDAHQLVAVRVSKPAGAPDSVSPVEFEQWHAQSRLAEYAGAQPTARGLLRREIGDAVTFRPVTTNFFVVLGLEPRFGRGLTPADTHAPRGAVVSDAAWRRLFNADPGVVGSSIVLDGERYAIVGILAGAGLEFDADADFFVPFDPAAVAPAQRLLQTMDVYGRIRPGTVLEQAEAELQTITARNLPQSPDERASHAIHLLDLRKATTGFHWRQLYFFLAAALLVMVLTCLNVAGLLFARGLARAREFALRAALGGSRGALMRQLLVEGAVLAVPAITIGLLMSVWILRSFTAWIPPGYLQRGGHFSIDIRVGAVVSALLCATVVVLALVPLGAALRVNLAAALGAGTRTTRQSTAQRRLRLGLLVAELTASLVLSTVTGLLLLSFVRLASTPLGFDGRQRLALRIALPEARYADGNAIRDYYARLLEQVRGIPGIAEAALGSSLPLDSRGGAAVQVVVPDRPRPPKGKEPVALIRTVSPEYFGALGIRLAAGREFTTDDGSGAPRVAIVNELLAARLFPEGTAVGGRLEIIPRARAGWTSKGGLVTVVGVVQNVKNFGIDEIEFNNVYLVLPQTPAPTLELVARTTLPAQSVIGPLWRTTTALDADVLVGAVTQLSEREAAALRTGRFNAVLIAFFAVVAALLAGVGIYGALASRVEDRTGEFGIRLALGAARSRIFAQSLWEIAWVGIVSCVCGAVLLLVIARFLGNALYLVPGQHGGVLYRVTTTDPLVLAAACMALLFTVMISGSAPAIRASRTSIVAALKNQ